MPSFFTILSVASTIGKAFVSYQQAAAMKAYYDAQADVARLQGRVKRVEAQEAGNRALRKLNENLASNVARAAAGGINPFTGTPSVIETINMRYGVSDYLLAKDTAELSYNMGIAQSQMLRDAGSMYEQGGLLGAITDVGTGTYNIFKQTGSFSSPFYQATANFGTMSSLFDKSDYIGKEP